MQINATENPRRLLIVDAPYGAKPGQKIDFEVEVHIDAQWVGIEYPIADARKERAFEDYVRRVIVAAVNGCEEVAKESGADSLEIARNLRHWPEMLATCERLLDQLALYEKEMCRRRATESLAVLEAGRALLSQIRRPTRADERDNPRADQPAVQARMVGRVQRAG